MVVISDEITKKIREFLHTLTVHGLHVDKAIIFGSYAKGTADEWSDIDVALVSNDFSGVGFFDRKKINPYIIQIYSKIEPHPFRVEEFNEENPFVQEILKEGIEIK